MTRLLKIVGALIVFVIVTFFIKTIFSITTGLAGWTSTTLSFGSAMLISWYMWRWFSGDHIGVAAAVLCGTFVLGGLSFIFGFFGPMLFAQDTQQAAFVGIFIAAPLGMVLGAIVGYFLAYKQRC